MWARVCAASSGQFRSLYRLPDLQARSVSVFSMPFPATVVVAVLFGLSVTWAMFGSTMGGSGMSLSAPIAWHAVLMTWAFGVLMPLGRWVYHTGSMPKTEKRLLHRTVMVLATVLVLAGYAGVFAAHWPMARYFGFDFKKGSFSGPASKFMHIFLGYALVLGTFAQAFMGASKYQKLVTEGEDKKIYSSHGTIGKAIIAGGCINVMLAAWFWGWSTPVMVTIWVLAAGTAALGAFVSGTEASPEQAPFASPQAA